MPDPGSVLATLRPSPIRRWAAIGMTGALGLICLSLALLRPPAEPVWLVVLVVLGGGALWLSRRVALATATVVELTPTGLRDGAGRPIAPLRQIVTVERGAFAFKPSNGFLVRLSEPGDLAWQPGLWWRVGRSVGVGGVTPSLQGRLMADAIAALLLRQGRGR